ncbi:MAG: DUF4440 domain-containing protein [Bacteroidota bacterium]
MTYRSMMRTSIFLLALVLTACAGTRTDWTYDSIRIVEGDPADVQAIVAQARAFSAAYVAGDTEALLEVYAEDGIAAPGGRDFIRGREALREFWQARPDVSIREHRLRPNELWVSGDLAYDWGIYEGVSQREGAEPEAFRGKYLVVWQRDADGMWRMANDMWNSLD